MSPKVYMVSKADSFSMERETKAFSCSLIVDVNVYPSDNEVLSDWIIDSGHRGGYNNRESCRAWWLDPDRLVKVELDRI